MPHTNHLNYEKDYHGSLIDSGTKPQERILVGIPLTGLLRAEWMLARYGQVIPCNWAQSDMLMFISSLSPVGYSVADARNIIATAAVEGNYEWLLFIDHDTILPNTFILKANERMIEGKKNKDNFYPVWSGLYFTKSVPSEPLIYKEIGKGYHSDWNFGDQVPVAAVPMGCTMIDVRLLKLMYDEAPWYATSIAGKQAKQIFNTPSMLYLDPENMSTGIATGTEDIHWCQRLISGNYFERAHELYPEAGFDKFIGSPTPFLCDTTIFCRHIDFSGNQYPSRGEEFAFVPKEWLETDKQGFIRKLNDVFEMLPKEDKLK